MCGSVFNLLNLVSFSVSPGRVRKFKCLRKYHEVRFAPVSVHYGDKEYNAVGNNGVTGFIRGKDERSPVTGTYVVTEVSMTPVRATVGATSGCEEFDLRADTSS